MKVLSVQIYKYDVEKPLKLCEEWELSSFSFFKRGTAKEICTFVSRGVVSKSKPNESSCVTHQDMRAHVRMPGDKQLAVVCVTDDDYPQRAAMAVCEKALNQFEDCHAASVWQSATQDMALTVPSLAQLLLDAQEPANIDKLTAIESDLAETKKVLLKSVDDLLERNEKLEALMDKSEDLSFQSKAFLNNSEKLNSCCTLL